MGQFMTQFNTRWYHRAAIWIGIGINPASVTLGGGLASRLPFSSLIWLMPIGTLIISGICVLAGILGRRRRQPFTKWAHVSFGQGGGLLLIYLMMGLGMVGWSGFQHGLAGTSLGKLLGLQPWMGVIILGISVFLVVNLGPNRWNSLVWLTTTASFGLVFIALWIVRAKNLNPVPSDQLSTQTAVWILGSIIAFASLFALRCPDFTWDLMSDKDVIYDGTAFFASLLTSLFVGASLFRATGEWDLTIIFGSSSLAGLAQLFLVISLLSPALSTTHSGTLVWEEILPLSYRSSMALLLAAGVTLGLLRFDRQLLFFLDWIAAVLPSAMAVMIGQSLQKEANSDKVAALLAWLGGAFTAVLFKLNGQIIHLFAGALMSIFLLVALQRRSHFLLTKK